VNQGNRPCDPRSWYPDSYVVCSASENCRLGLGRLQRKAEQLNRVENVAFLFTSLMPPHTSAQIDSAKSRGRTLTGSPGGVAPIIYLGKGDSLSGCWGAFTQDATAAVCKLHDWLFALRLDLEAAARSREVSDAPAASGTC